MNFKIKIAKYCLGILVVTVIFGLYQAKEKNLTPFKNKSQSILSKTEANQLNIDINEYLKSDYSDFLLKKYK